MPTDGARALILPFTAAAAAVGIACGVSPGGCVIVVLLLTVCAWATRDLAGTERRWVLGVIGAAVALRVAAIAALAWYSNPQQESFAALFPDARYALSRSLWIRNIAVGVPVSPLNYFRAFEPNYGENAYNFVLASLHLLFGPSPYASHLLSTLVFFCAVLMLFRLARRSYGAAAALLGLSILVFMPSLFAWSVSPLKEAPSALAVAVVVAAIAAGAWASNRSARMAAGVIAVLALIAFRAIRPEGLWLALAGLGLGLATWLLIGRRALMLAAAGIVVLALAAAVIVPRVHDRALSLLQQAAWRHYLHAVSVGHFYRLLDAKYYPPNEATFNPRDAGASSRFLIRAAVRFVTVPEPWILRPGFELVVIPQQMVWYVLVIGAGCGVWYGMKRDRLLTSLLAGLCVGSWLLIGPTSGNIGTMVRHRDSLMPWVVWLSAVGLVSVVPAMPVRVRRWNVADAGVAALLVLALPVGFGLFWLFQTPMPRVGEIAPNTLAAGSRAVLRGQHLRPFLKVFVVETGGTFTLADRTAWPPEAKYWLRTTEEAQIELPDLAPGVYDLALTDGVDPLAKLPRAFTVPAPVPPGSVALTVRGRFLGVEPGSAARLAAADAAVATPWMEIVRIEAPVSDRRSISTGGVYVTAVVDGRVQVPATLRVRCTLAGTECRAGGLAFAAGTQVPLLAGGDRLMFTVDHVEGAGVTALTPGKSVDVLARFLVPPFVGRLIAAGDRDAPAETHPVPVVAQVVRVAEMTSSNGRAIVDVVVRVPAALDGTSTYRGHRMAPGAPLAFETDRYAVSGTVITVSLGGDRP